MCSFPRQSKRSDAPISRVLRCATSPTLLNAILTGNDLPLYTIETIGKHTSISHCSFGRPSAFATVQWAEPASPSADLLADTVCSAWGNEERASSILKSSGILSASRKFRVPGQPETYKWKRVAGTWQCVSLGLLVASLESTPTSLRLNMHTIPEPRIFNDDTAVRASIASREALLDMIVLTALLVLTRPDDLKSMPSSSSSPPASPTSISARTNISAPPSPSLSSRSRRRAATVSARSDESRQPPPRHAFDVARTESFLDLGVPQDPPSPVTPNSTHRADRLEALWTALNEPETTDSNPPPPYSPVEPRGSWSSQSHHHHHHHSSSPSKSLSLTRSVQGTVHRLRALNPDVSI